MKRTLDEWLTWQENLHPDEIDLGLERVNAVLKVLLPSLFSNEKHGNNLVNKQQLPFTLLTIGGTNGKGSTIEFLHSILEHSGYQVGVYTSPHFVDYNERIQINHQLIPDDALCEAFEAIDKARKSLSNVPTITYFEFSTLAAIYYFVQQQCDVVILEVGLGGRLDAVNCLDADCSLVTTVDLDHQDWLGDTIDKIAYEKAGIYRQDKKAIYGDENLPKSIASLTQESNIPLLKFGQDYSYGLNAHNWQWQYGSQGLNLIFPNISGKVQLKNISNALMVLYSLKTKFKNLSETTINQGISNTNLRGRLQKINDSPECLVDVAHNPQAARYLRDYLTENKTKGQTIAIFSMLADKDIKSVISTMSNVIDHWYVYSLNTPRAIASKKIQQLISDSMGESFVTCYNNFEDAYRAAEINSSDHVKPEKHAHRIIIFGSFITVSDALDFFYEK